MAKAPKERILSRVHPRCSKHIMGRVLSYLALSDKGWTDILGEISRKEGRSHAIKTGDPLIDELEEALARGEDYEEASRRILGS